LRSPTKKGLTGGGGDALQGKKKGEPSLYDRRKKLKALAGKKKGGALNQKKKKKKERPGVRTNAPKKRPSIHCPSGKEGMSGGI